MTSNRFQPRVSFIAASTCLWLCAGCFDPLITDPQMEEAEGSESTGVDAEDSSGEVDPDDSTGDAPAICGDGVVEGDEQCDDGINDGSYGGCTADCTALGPHCGDGVLNGEEPCDDGDGVDGNGCNVDCVVSGTVLWTVTYDGPDQGTDHAYSVAVDSEDNIVVAGRSQVADHSAIWLGKYSSSGELLWQTTQSAFENDAIGYELAIAPNNDIIVVGSTINPRNSENRDAWIRRHAPNGDNIWTITHNGPTNENDIADTIDIDTDGNLYIGIREYQTTIGNGIVQLVQKLDPDGNEIWTTFLPNGSRINDLEVTGDNNIVIAGQEGTPEHWTPLLGNFTSDGRTIWLQTYPEHAPGTFKSISVNTDSEIVTTTSVQGESASNVLRFDPTGNLLWLDDPLDSQQGSAQAAIIENNGQIIATGSRGVDDEIWVRKYGADNHELWTNTYNGEESVWPVDQGTSVAVDSHHNVIVAGFIDTNTLYGDVWIRKYSP